MTYDVVSMRAKISDIVGRCTACWAYNPRPRRGEQQSIAVPFSPYMVASIDNIDPIPLSKEQFRYIFSWVDGFTRVCTARPLRDVTSISICTALKSIIEEKGHI